MADAELPLPMSALDIADWRLKTFALYAEVRERAAADPAAAHRLWRERRDTMFGSHPASALDSTKKAGFSGLAVAPYDPAFRFRVALDGEGAGERMEVETGTEGVVPFLRLGTFDVPEVGRLAAWELKSYGGGIFLPFRDATAGKPGGSYGAGRYLLDTVKGAFHGTDADGGTPTFILDFNFAYNPSCAYNEYWACPLPGPANRVPASVTAGEMYLPELV